uniref:Putative ovule protein n=1 Tax=Solanum chacoense TaxID=4108 RepID=A0A0V0GZW4_SOLCH
MQYWNLEEQVDNYINISCSEFKDHIRSRWKGRKPSSTDIEKIVNKYFIDWFPRKIMNPDILNIVSEDDLKFLANGPAPHARRFTILISMESNFGPQVENMS